MLHGPRLKPSTTVRRWSNARSWIHGGTRSRIILGRQELATAYSASCGPAYGQSSNCHSSVSPLCHVPSNTRFREARYAIAPYDVRSSKSASTAWKGWRRPRCDSGVEAVPASKPRQPRHRLQSRSRRKRSSPMISAAASKASRFRRQARFQRGQTPQATPQTLVLARPNVRAPAGSLKSPRRAG
jgi:hypothetical protein